MKANYNTKSPDKTSGNLNLSLYELNKAAVQQLPDYTEEQKKTSIAVIDNFANDGTFYMLLGRELNYYTLFFKEDHPDNIETIGEGVIDCLNHIGKIKSIEETEDKSAVEIWVQHEDTATVLYFFLYDQGVIKCK